MAPDETEVRLIIDVVVIGEITCRYQSFALILLQLDVEAPVSQPRDDAREGLTQAGDHVLDLLVLDRGALGIGCHTLHLRGMVTLILQRSGIRRRLTLDEVACEEAVHHQVRVATDRRGEVRIAIEAKAVVTDMRRGIACLSHRADSEHRQHILLGLTLDISE